jgi:fructose-bisphosphate aldolase, class I
MSNSINQSENSIARIKELLGDKAGYFLDYQSKSLGKDQLHLPGPDFVDRVWIGSDRPIPALRSLQNAIQDVYLCKEVTVA